MNNLNKQNKRLFETVGDLNTLIWFIIKKQKFSSIVICI